MKKKAIYIYIGLMLLIFSTGCFTPYKLVCRHNAMISALRLSEEYPIRIAYGFIGGIDNRHVQSQALIDGEWKWLSVMENDVYISKKDDEFIVLKYMTIEEVLGTWFNKRNAKK